MKIGFITSRFPYPLEKGDKLRAFQHIKAMSEKHEVHLFALSDVPVSEQDFQVIASHCASVNLYRLSKWQILKNLLNALFKGLPLQVGYFFSDSIRSRMNNDIKRLHPDLVYCQLIRTALYGKDVDSTKLIDYQDAFVTGTEQRLKRASVLLRPLFRREVRKVQDFEHDSFEWFDQHLVISERDRGGIAHLENSRIKVLPNGVDTDHYFPVSGNSNGKNVLFVGNMNYTPNVDAAVFLAREIMPKVWASDPEIHLTLAGANPSVIVKQLAGPSINVTGWVDDIREEYRKADLFVAPMRIGTGIQNKIMEAMAMGLPCITTSLSAVPLGVSPGQDLEVGDTADALAGKILDLTVNAEKASGIAGNGRRFVEEHYSITKMNHLLNELIESRF